MQPREVPTITADELTDEMVLLDVREPYEWAAGHAVGALHIPLGAVPSRFSDLPQDADVVVVCHVGQRSARATMWLLEQGYECRNLAGGMIAYAAEGRPLESDTGRPPIVD
jgi:rhodanese-related sulfurtransferase